MTIRGDILALAKSLTEVDRNQIHGEPKANMALFADLVFDYIAHNRGGGNGYLTPTDGAIILCLHKISRIVANPNHTDNYVDLAAYAAIAGECAGVSLQNEAE